MPRESLTAAPVGCSGLFGEANRRPAENLAPAAGDRNGDGNPLYQAWPHDGGDAACPGRARTTRLGSPVSATAPNTTLSRRGRLGRHHLREGLTAAPVGCSGWFGVTRPSLTYIRTTPAATDTAPAAPRTPPPSKPP